MNYLLVMPRFVDTVGHSIISRLGSLMYLPAVQSANAYLIDNSRIKQGGVIEGKEIHAPAILDALSIDTVVIPVVSYVTTIEKQIRAEYPHVKEVINILDLIRPMVEDAVLVC